MKTLIHILLIMLFLLFVVLTCTPGRAQVQRIPHDTGGNSYSIRTGGISRDQAEALRKEAGKNGIREVFVDTGACWIIFITDACTTPRQVRALIESTGVTI